MAIKCADWDVPTAPRDPGEWYAMKAQEARKLAELLDFARQLGVEQRVLKFIEARLEDARYVGD